MAKENKHTAKFEELCAGYVLDALKPGEREEFEAMLPDVSEEQRKLYINLRSTANQLAFTMERSKPSGNVKEQLLEYVRSKKTDENTGVQAESRGAGEEENEDSRTYFAVAASFALLIISLSLLFYSFNLTSQMSEKDRVIGNQQAQITSLQDEIRQKDELLSILESREVDMVLLAGMEASPNGYGKIVWDPENNRALLQVSNLPAVPSDRDYQLWIIKNNRSVSAGVFAVRDPERDAFFTIEQMAPADSQSTNAFAVTLEPKGGMPQPTGDMYLMGNMNNQ